MSDLSIRFETEAEIYLFVPPDMALAEARQLILAAKAMRAALITALDYILADPPDDEASAPIWAEYNDLVDVLHNAIAKAGGRDA